MDNRAKFVVMGGLAFVLLLALGCSQGFSTRGSEDSQAPVPGVTATPVRPASEARGPTPGATTTLEGPAVRPPALTVTPTPSSGSVAQVELIPQGQADRSHSANSVTVEAALQGKWLTGSKELVFNIVMDTHSVDLDKYDLTSLAVLRDDQGREFKPVAWNAPKGGHHRSGVLTFRSDQPILQPGTTIMELSISNIANAAHLLRWDLRPVAS